MDGSRMSGAEVRRLARAGELTGPTPGLALGYVQANLVVVPRELAFDFLLFCQRNPKPCPLLDVTEPGSAEPTRVALGAGGVAQVHAGAPQRQWFRTSYWSARA